MSPSDPAELPEYSTGRIAEARSRENFPIAAWLLRPGRRVARSAIYGFARFVDDIGDERLGDPMAQLNLCERELDLCYGGSPHHPIFQRLQPVVERYQLDPLPFRRLIAANRQDQEVLSYRTWAELDRYCTLSATPVGELVLALEGIRDPDRIGWSDSICIGLQLANMWQDIASDRGRGRRYLPLEVLEQHGGSDSEWWEGRPTPGTRAALLHAVGRARHLLSEGWPLVAAVPGLMKVEMATFIRSGLAATDAVLQAGDLVFTQKAVIPRSARRRAVLGAGVAWRRPVRA